MINQVKQSVNSRSYYFSYTGTFNIVLLPLVDADYEFTYIDIDDNGRIIEREVYRKASLTLENNSVNILKKRNVDNFMMLPLVIVGDDNFPMKPFLRKCNSKNNLSIG